jgi:hypothetical protein
LFADLRLLSILQQGSDPDTAERASLAVLELAPDRAEARHNLAVLRRDRRRLRDTADAVFSGNIGLAELSCAARRAAHPLREHLPALVVLARSCQHITVSARASARPRRRSCMQGHTAWCVSTV